MYRNKHYHVLLFRMLCQMLFAASIEIFTYTKEMHILRFGLNYSMVDNVMEGTVSTLLYNMMRRQQNIYTKVRFSYYYQLGLSFIDSMFIILSEIYVCG